jgi:hypothetical protein
MPPQIALGTHWEASGRGGLSPYMPGREALSDSRKPLASSSLALDEVTRS